MKDVELSLFWVLAHAKTQIDQHKNISLNACKHTRQKTGMIICANSLLCTRTNNDTTHSATVSYVERQIFDFGGTHLFAQPIKWQWGASLAGNNSNEPLLKCHASNIPRQKKPSTTEELPLILFCPFKTLLFCQVWESHLLYKFIKFEQFFTCSLCLEQFAQIFEYLWQQRSVMKTQ